MNAATRTASRFFKRHPRVGARPGTLVIPDDAPPTTIRMVEDSGAEIREHEVRDLETLRRAFDGGTTTWIDVQGFGDRDRIDAIGSTFGLHPLLLEDVVNVPQRPKVESYGDQVLIIVRMIPVDIAERAEPEQLSLVLGPHYVLTFQERHGHLLAPIRRRIRSRKGAPSGMGADYLAYALVDTVVDAYYPALERIGERLEDLETEVIERPTPEVLGRLHHLKNRLVDLRRGIWPQREALNALVRGDFPAITDPVRIYLRDTHDHCVQTSEVAEMYREMVSGLMNTYLSSVANRTNDVMKVLTIVATIFIPLSFLAGVYGMNFEHMPELHSRWAYPTLWALMVGVAGGMLAFFWRKGWIGPGG
ncbi:magnesium/cobalt transporter CorA [Tautonia plasticadhaerens]|uniref:magnesium/cobalt transporter CorA n=1 Tax=Tautonia plasticadhaerens TaxID=2527974 RepID=UPI0018D25F1B|nr:magnesium/cobalt transporter CorA [Tautonia plasticadhaerens]